MIRADNTTSANNEERGVLDVIRGIQHGHLNPRDLSLEERRLCVAHLGAEGLSVPEMAQILRRCERTIARDRRATHEENAIEADPRLAGIFAGRLATEAESSISRIRRVARAKDAPHAVRIDGERACFDILDRLVQRLQSLGFLPSAAQRIQADLTHNVGDLPSLGDLRAELERLERIEHDVIDAEATVISPPADQSIHHGRERGEA